MASINVTTEATTLDTSGYPDLRSSNQVLVIQNLGPGALYIDSSEDVDASTGIKLDAGVVWEMGHYDPSRPVYLVSASTSDVRFTALD